MSARRAGASEGPNGPSDNDGYFRPRTFGIRSLQALGGAL